MSLFEQKRWVDTASEYPNRRKLTDTTSGVERTVDVIRQEGQIHATGVPFNSTTMNDLEGRIDEVVQECQDNFQAAIDRIYQTCVDNGIRPTASTPEAIVTAIGQIRTGGDATSGDVLYGKSIYSENGLVIGNMPNKGAWTGNSPSGQGQVRVPIGYHNGDGYVNSNNSWTAGRVQGKADKRYHTIFVDGTFASYDNVPFVVALDGVTIGTVTQGFSHEGWIDAAINNTNGLVDITYHTEEDV